METKNTSKTWEELINDYILAGAWVDEAKRLKKQENIKRKWLEKREKQEEKQEEK